MSAAKQIDFEIERRARAIAAQVWAGNTVILRDRRTNNQILFFNTSNAGKVRQTLTESPDCTAWVKFKDKPGEYPCPGFEIAERAEEPVLAPEAELVDTPPVEEPGPAPAPTSAPTSTPAPVEAKASADVPAEATEEAAPASSSTPTPAPAAVGAEVPAEVAPAAKPKVKAAPKVESPQVEEKPEAKTPESDNDNHSDAGKGGEAGDGGGVGGEAVAGDVGDVGGGEADADDEPKAEPSTNGREISIPVKDRPCYRVFEKWTHVTEDEKKCSPGVHHFGTEKKGDKEFYTHTYVCSPLYVDAIAADDQGNNFGRLLRFKNSKNNWRSWAMPMELLAGSGEDLRSELLAMGVIINHNARHQHFPKYFLETKPTRFVKCATQVGWSGTSFVLPGKVIGPHASNVIFQSGESTQAEYSQRGTVDGWREHVAAPAVQNPVLMAAISAAFAGPLLEKVQGESGGFHLVGNSSSGKTTALRAAASAWGGPRHARSWNSTSNGMESVAALFNDGLLAIDEASEGSARDIERIIYGLGNGVGKQRANRSGGAKSVTHFKCFIVSTGEKMIATELENAGLQSKAGGEIRLLDIPVARAHGVFDDLHGAASGADFANAIKDAVAKHHGKAGPAFLERLTHDTRNWSEHFEAVKRLPAFAVEGDAGQDRRAAARFALLGMAGELATEYGLTGWQPGAAIKAAATMFSLWKAQRKAARKSR